MSGRVKVQGSTCEFAGHEWAEIEVRADGVRLGDYLLGLGRVNGKTTHGKRVTLHSEGDDWKVSVDRRHRVVVLRAAGETP